MSEIALNHLKVTYIDRHNKSVAPFIAINDLSAIFEDGLNVIIGPSGCGKTSLIRAILGLINYEGEITLDGSDISMYSIGERNFAYVNQNIALQPHMTIFDNIAFPLKIKGIDKVEIIKQVNEIAKDLDIEECLSRKPRHISIGQAQRAALARALVKRASFYFFGEPFSNLDVINRNEERLLVKKLMNKYGASMIYVTHNILEATSMADNIYVMDKGDIIFKGNAEELYKSSNPIVQELIRCSDE